MTSITISFQGSVDAKVVERELNKLLFKTSIDRTINDLHIKIADNGPMLPWVLNQIADVCVKYAIVD